ncbi:hypothetical protein D0T12_05755 [Actinomadura spongiicola]|uniref:Uncharacterized protein n=1 Tax=Actinomadura spongiicola TaxID=2303421 RepID=A0A372GL95_9ACTN|nr:hypothetical protein [Actinomadura spongiicola]RFS86130.1 hypothetical protein D0T12_05755 [Actinomadura spongiicola]
MDLESELRKAMAEQVAEASASPSLVADVKRRHRRRKARTHTAAAVAAASVAALILVPTYQSFRATPVGTVGTERPTSNVPASQRPERPPAPGQSRPPSNKERPGAGTSAKPKPPPSPGGPEAGPRRPGPGGVVDDLPRWITYLPDGLAAASPCAVAGGAERRTTTCAWRGDAGWVEIVLVRSQGLSDPRDLMRPAGIPGRTTVRGMPAFTIDRPDSGRQISWLARPGVGVTVSAGGSVKGQLMRIAEGVRP